MSKHSPNDTWKDEFYSSNLYRMLNKVKADDVEKTVGKVIDIAGKTVQQVEKVVDDAVTGKNGRPVQQTPPHNGAHHTGDGAFHAGQNWNGQANPSQNNPGPSPFDTRNRNPYQRTGPGGYSYTKNPRPSAPTTNKKKKYKKNDTPPEGMRLVHHKSLAKYYICAVLFLMYGLTADFDGEFLAYTWQGLIPLLIVFAMLFGLFSLIFRGKWVPEPIPEEPKPKAEPKSSGNPEVDRIVAEGTEYLRRLRKADENIEDEEISDAIVRMEEISFRIFAYIYDHPNKVGQTRKFMNYYLPTTLKLLESYDHMSRQDVSGENISQSMLEIERIMQTIVLAFEKQLDSLFQDEAMDISTDITVLEGMMAQEGISADDESVADKEEKEAESPSLKF